MGFKAGAKMKRDIPTRSKDVVLTSFPIGMRVVVDLDAIWTQYVCTSESIADLRAAAGKFLRRLLDYEPNEVVLARESSGVPARKSVEHEKRDVGVLPEASLAEFARQWKSGEDNYLEIARVGELDIAPREISARLRKDRKTRALLRDDFIAGVLAAHKENKCDWPLVVHGDKIIRDGVETDVVGYNPGEGEFKFGYYLDDTPTVFLTIDSDAIAVILSGLPQDARPETHILHIGDLFDMGALRRTFADRSDLDAWLLGWMMCGTDYMANPPRLGTISLERACERYGPKILRGVITYEDGTAFLQANRVMQYWFVLRNVPWLVSDWKKPESRAAEKAKGFHDAMNDCVDPDDALKKMVATIGEAKYELFASQHSKLALDLAWNVRYFMGAGRVNPGE